MATNKISYNKKSIMNILTDSNVVTGDVTLQEKYLRMTGVSSAKYVYNYGSSKLLNSNYIKLAYKIIMVDAANYTTRYSTNISIVVNVQYYDTLLDADGNVLEYVDGVCEQFIAYPFIKSESDGYRGSIEFEIHNDIGIKSIEVNLINNTTYDLQFYYVKLYKSLNTEEVVVNTYSVGLTVSKIEFAPNGLTVTYGQESMQTVIGCYSDELGNITGLSLNPFTDYQRYVEIASTTTPITLPEE